MRRGAQRVEHAHFHAANRLDGGQRHFLAIAHVSELLHAALRKEVAVRRRPAVRQRKRRHAQVANLKRAINDARLRDEVTLRPRPVVKSVSKDAPQRLHRLSARIDRQRLEAAQIAEAPAIVQPHDVVRVRVREDDRVQPVDFFAQHLDAKLRRRIDHQLDLVGGEVDGRTRAMVLRGWPETSPGIPCR